MSIKIFDHEQGSPEWRKVRSGLVTASELHSVLAGGKGLTRKAYMNRLAIEIVTGEPVETYQNDHMRRGNEMEAEARNYYAFLKDVELTTVGFLLNDKLKVGCSPDALVGKSGALEVKTKLPALLVDCILRNELPPEHKAQCQGTLWAGELEWIDLEVFWKGLPAFVTRAVRDETYIKNLRTAVVQFQSELHEVVEKIKAYRP